MPSGVFTELKHLSASFPSNPFLQPLSDIVDRIDVWGNGFWVKQRWIFPEMECLMDKVCKIKVSSYSVCNSFRRYSNVLWILWAATWSHGPADGIALAKHAQDAYWFLGAIWDLLQSIVQHGIASISRSNLDRDKVTYKIYSYILYWCFIHSFLQVICEMQLYLIYELCNYQCGV